MVVGGLGDVSAGMQLVAAQDVLGRPPDVVSVTIGRDAISASARTSAKTSSPLRRGRFRSSNIRSIPFAYRLYLRLPAVSWMRARLCRTPAAAGAPGHAPGPFGIKIFYGRTGWAPAPATVTAFAAKQDVRWAG